MNGPTLRDIQVPAAPWWPLAPGWWIVAAAVLVVAVLVFWIVRRRTTWTPLRAALHEIDALQSAWRRGGDADLVVDRASRLLRRIAVRVDPPVAARTGEPWRGFVHRYAPDPQSRTTLDRLLDARFQMHPALDVPALCDALRGWCRAALGRNGWAGAVARATRLRGANAR